MSKQRTDWEEIFRDYKSSGLSQLAFCKQNNLSRNQFRYRWEVRNRGLKPPTSPSAFETIALLSPLENSTVITTISMLIHLPNQIRCEVRTDLNGFSHILTQLVQPC